MESLSVNQLLVDLHTRDPKVRVTLMILEMTCRDDPMTPPESVVSG